MSCGFINELGRFESELQPEPDRKTESKISRTLKRFVNMDEDKVSYFFLSFPLSPLEPWTSCHKKILVQEWAMGNFCFVLDDALSTSAFRKGLIHELVQDSHHSNIEKFTICQSCLGQPSQGGHCVHVQEPVPTAM